MLEETRRAFRTVLKTETDPAAKQWLRRMLAGDDSPRRQRKRRRRRKVAPDKD